ncbi:MAG: Rieske 2Fe-2S domain-containing protein [Acidimicrobiales bacterium]
MGPDHDGAGAGREARAGATLSNTHPALKHCWHPVARSTEITDRPRRVELLGDPWVLVRLKAPEAGADGDLAPGLYAFEDRCPHRQAPLSIGAVEDGVLRCAYHGWCFDAGGRCVDIPALGPGATLPPRARLRAAHAVVERYGTVFLLPEEPLPGLEWLPEIAEAHDPAFLQGDLPPMRATACAGLLADNFLDMAHFPFVHVATFGDTEPVVPPLTVARGSGQPGDTDRWTFTAVSEHTFVNREDPGVKAGIRPLVQRRRVSYRVVAPFHLVLRLDFLDAGGTNVIGFFLQPEHETSCRIYSSLWRDDLTGDPARMASAVDFEVRVVEEDLAIQQAYDVRALPLDPTVEVHTRADRATLELRRLLADLVAEVAGSAEGGVGTGAGHAGPVALRAPAATPDAGVPARG